MAKHDWYTDEDGEIDIWRLDAGYCNGPECRRCHNVYCHHCEYEIYETECPSGQLELF